LDSRAPSQAKEAFYPPLLNALWVQRQFSLVEKYARNYREMFPRGENRETVFLFQLQALEALGRLQEATRLLDAADRPKNRDIDLLEARIRTLLLDDQGLIASRKDSSSGEPAAPETLLLQADALRRAGQATQALKLYDQLVEGSFSDQAAYRRAELNLVLGNESAGLKILQQLAEEGKDPLWCKLADEALQLAVRKVQNQGGQP
jgi:tetratricopeptide (TPR) repeat protein